LAPPPPQEARLAYDTCAEPRGSPLTGAECERVEVRCLEMAHEQRSGEMTAPAGGS
jgi:hypothetical protein